MHHFLYIADANTTPADAVDRILLYNKDYNTENNNDVHVNYNPDSTNSTVPKGRNQNHVSVVVDLPRNTNCFRRS